MVVCLRWLYYHILSSITYISREHWDFVSIIDDQFMVFANDRIHYGLQVVSVRLQITPSHYHHYADLSWRLWTTNMFVRYMLPSVCLRLRQFSQLSFIQYIYGAVCLQLTQFSCDDRENVYFILLSSSNRKYESLTIVPCPGQFLP